MRDMASVEQVLNSRCSCDFDNNPKMNHWGMYSKDKPPSEKELQSTLECCRVPQFSEKRLLLWQENDFLFFGFQKPGDPYETRLLNIDSGMQQEAAYLACTAIGLGTCIFNLGVEGTERGDRFATTRQLILRKVDSLGFSTSPPGPEKPFKKGRNLTEPRRDGNRACLTELRLLTLSENTGTMANETDISKMLWAARGRTPHYVKSHPWGITIPTWGGVQNHTSVYLWKENSLFQYVNWTTPFFRLWWVLGNPTHDIKLVKNVNVGPDLNDATAAIILTENEKTNRALWEVGYMLENMFLQTRSVGISYEAKVFTDCEIERLKRSGVTGAVAAVLL